MEEHRREEPPPVPVGDERAKEDAFAVNLVAGAVDLAAERELEEVDPDVDPDERLRDEGAGALEARAASALRDARGALRRAGVVGTADPDRREGHAVLADRPAALRAGDHRLPVGMAIAVQRFGGRSQGAAVA